MQPRMARPHPQFLIQSVLGERGVRMCVCNKVPGDADASGRGTTPGEPLMKYWRIWAPPLDRPRLT